MSTKAAAAALETPGHNPAVAPPFPADPFPPTTLESSHFLSQTEKLSAFDVVAVDDIVQRLDTLSTLALSTRPTLTFKLPGDVTGQDIINRFDEHPARRRLRISSDLSLLEVSMPGLLHQEIVCAVIKVVVGVAAVRFSEGIAGLGLPPATAARVLAALDIEPSSPWGQSDAL